MVFLVKKNVGLERLQELREFNTKSKSDIKCSFKELLNYYLQYPEIENLLNDWELDFLLNSYEQVEKKGWLSDKQREVIRRIGMKLKG